MNKIPVIPTVVETYAFVFGRLGRIIGLIWLPAVLMTLSGYFLLLPVLRLLAGNPDVDELTRHGDVVFGFYTFLFLLVFLMATMMTAITREALHPGDNPVRFGFPPLRMVFRVFAGYVGLIVFVIAAIAVVDVLAAISGMVSPALASVIAGFGSLLAAVYLLLRPGFLLVPAATEGDTSGLIDSWKLGRGNVGRILAVAIAALLPPLLAAEFAGMWIIGPDAVPMPPAGDDGGAYNAAVLALQAAHFPALISVNFLLLPFGCGLPAVAAAKSYRALTCASSST